MGLISNVRNLFRRGENVSTVNYRFENSHSVAFSVTQGDIYDNDLVRSSVWPIAEACAKVDLVHIRGDGEKMQKNADLQIAQLLVQANSYMSMQDLIYRIVIDREINNNAFVHIVRDAFGKPLALYPIEYSSVRVKYDTQGNLYCIFRFMDAKDMRIPYSDILHIRKHFSKKFFGADSSAGLHNIMAIIQTTDRGMVEAVKQGAQINWLLKFLTVLTPKDKKEQIKQFGENYLESKNNPYGFVVSDANAEAIQVKPNSYVPNALQMEKAQRRLMMYFGINEKIIDGSYSEEEYNSFYESKVEPLLKQLVTQMTLKFFTAKERGFKNRIVAESISLQYASNKTKLSLVSMVDRGALLVNEWRATMNLAPVPGGDEPIRRLDTLPVTTEPLPDEDAPDKAEAPPPAAQKTDKKTDEKRQKMNPEERNNRSFMVRSLPVDSKKPPEERSYIIEGEAVVFDQETVLFVTDGIEYKEIIARGALDGAQMDDVPLKFNHSDSYMTAARHNAARPNRSTMDFMITDKSLSIRADVGKTRGGRDLYEAVEAGVIDKMSFAFTVKEYKYDERAHTMTILKIDRLFDVSAVDTPAYNQTSLYARSEIWAEAQKKTQAAEALAERRQNLIQLIDGTLNTHKE